MPLSRMKPIQAFVVMCCVTAAMPLVASAQLGGRLWTPMTDLEKPQASQGLYASLEALYWSITPLKDYDIGYRHPDGSRASREAYSGGKAVLQHNTLDTSSLANNFSLGMRLEIGNTRDHHGWLISGYGLPGQSSSFTSTGGPGEKFEMVINDLVRNTTVLGNTGGHPGDDSDVYQASLWWDPSGLCDLYEGSNGQPYIPQHYLRFSGIVGPPYGSYPYTEVYAPVLFTVPVPVGFLWGWVPFTSGGGDVHITDPTFDSDGNITRESRAHTYYTYGIAPLPVSFDSISVNNKADNWSLEAMYTYRVHPTRWGNLDVLGGLRYWHLEDGFSVNAFGERLHTWDPDIDPDTADTMPISVLSNMAIDSTAVNRIVGPQIGLRYSKTANRYTGMLEGRFFAGVNTATLRNSGNIASYMNNPNDIGTDPANPLALSTVNGIGQAYVGVPMGLVGGANTYNYRRTKQLFSPGFELRANTHFQLTRQVGLQIGFSSMWVDQVVRGAAVNDYTVKSNGQFFGIRDDKQSRSGVLVYGATVGIVCNRF